MGQNAFDNLSPKDINSTKAEKAHQQHRLSINEHKAEIVTIEKHIKELDVQLKHFNKALTAAKRRLEGVEKTANEWAERRIKKRKEAEEEAERRKVLLREGAKNALKERGQRELSTTLDGGRRTRRRKKRPKRRRNTVAIEEDTIESN